MAIDLLHRAAPASPSTTRRLLLIWQNPTTSKFNRVGELDALGTGNYVFRYSKELDPGFSALVQFPDLASEYESESLPAFFANRVMSRQRDSYGDYRHWIGLDEAGQDTPMEVLARTGGGRATDTFHVVDDLQYASDGSVIIRFLASGVRHLAGADARLRQLTAGSRLYLRDEPDNKENRHAILIDAQANRPVGWIPDWLLGQVHELRGSADRIELIAERVNPAAPPHLRLLCRLEARLAYGS